MIGELAFGTVTRVEAATGRPYVQCRQRSGAHEYGPCPVIQGPWVAGQATEAAAGGAGDEAFASHVHGLGVDFAAGDSVLVGFVASSGGQAVVFGRLA